MLWLLIGIIHTGQACQFALIRELVQPLHIALAADLKRTLDVYLNKFANFPARPLACLSIGGNSGGNAYDTIACQQVADESDTFDVSIPILTAEAQALTQMSPHNIAIQHLYIEAAHPQTLLNDPGKGTLTRAREACKPDGKATVRHVSHSPISSCYCQSRQ